MAKLHYIMITGIIVKDEKYLIAKRSSKEKLFPGKWTVPGGKVDSSDYEKTEKDTEDVWYNLFEKALQREIMEETNLEVKNFGYVTSMAYKHPDGNPSLIISMHCDWKNNDVKLNEELDEYEWVSAKEAEKYDLIEGILEEIQMLDRKLKGDEMGVWSK